MFGDVEEVLFVVGLVDLLCYVVLGVMVGVVEWGDVDDG